MIEYLLKLLESSMERIDKPSSVKAQIVKAIKAMLNSTTYLSQVKIFLFFMIKVIYLNFYLI